MKTFNLNFKILGFILILYAFTTCNPSKSQEKKEYGKATQALIEIVENDPEVKSMLEKSLAMAKQLNPDKTTNPAQSLEEYYEFVTHCESNMPWELLPKTDYSGLLSQTSQGLVYFYFLLDQPLPELESKGNFKNTLQYAEPIASWLNTFNKSWARFLETEASWNEEYFQMALEDPAFGLHKGWYEDPSKWKTFNQFFARHLKSPDQRPIASPDDPSVVTAFADSRPQGVWPINENSGIVTKGGVPVKSATVHSIPDLLGEASAYKKAFANGTFTHSFLGISDYHRFHFPMGGTIKEIRVIPGVNPSGGEIWWDAKNKRYGFDPSSIGWQMVETRGCVILDTGEFGLVALLPIGMAVVNSVNLEKHLKPGDKVKKGDMLGHFAFGGSDFIMVFQEKVNFTLTAPREGEGYKHMLMGEELGRVK